jgi:hypothetical protein
MLDGTAKATTDESGRTLIDLVALPGRTGTLADAVERADGKLIAVSGPRVLAALDPARVTSLLESGTVRAARLADAGPRALARRLAAAGAKTGAVESEGVELTRADAWIGFDSSVYGLGRASAVRIGILDFGFEGYAALAGDELPAGVEARNFAPGWDIEGCIGGVPPCIPDGTAVAEIVADMAPSAQLVLVSVDPYDLASMDDAIDYLVGGGVAGAPVVDVIVTGLSWQPGLFGDGFGVGPISDYVEQATAAGVSWIGDVGDRDYLSLLLYDFVPAASDHWTGPFVDNVDHFFNGTFDNDGYMDKWFEEQDPQSGETWLNRFCLGPLEFILLDLVWDDWDDADGDGNPASKEDYSIDVYEDLGAGEIALFDSSANYLGNQQEGLPGQFPWDSLDVFNSSDTETVCFFLAVFNEAADGNNRFHMYWGADSDAAPGTVGAEFVAPSSLSAGNRLIPADSPTVFSVASTSVADQLEPFTTFGLPEEAVPVFCAPDDVSSVSLGSSFLSGFSAAHVAGAVGLLMEKINFLDPQRAIEVLEGRAKSLPGPAASRCGSGRLCLTTDGCP